MRYLILLLDLTLLYCHMNCNILNRLNIDKIATVKATRITV